MALTESQFAAANERAAKKQATTPQVVSVSYNARAKRIIVSLSTGLELMFSPEQAEGLEHATASELSEIEVSPSGFGIHFPRLDADLYLPSLLEGMLGSKKWMAATMGKAGGAASTAAKTAAARRNGQLGGRPKKVATHASL
jgi:hypothetical protein